ncbi:MAG: ABC transporter permease [Pseudomonadota bacterium]|nr:ABC transporter permease [Pseudomonadota bacterium]
MRIRDLLQYAGGAMRARRSRTLLSGLGIAIGITAVTLLTAIGQGLNQFMMAEFTQFGTNLVGITPGKQSTTGGPGGVLNNVRPLTIEDGEALRRIPEIEAVMAVIQGNAEIEAGNRTRRTTIFGVGHQSPAIWQNNPERGRFLPDDDPTHPRAFTVLGYKVAAELFPDRNPIGQIVRIAEGRYRVIGVVQEKGRFLGWDLDDTLFIPTAKALELFNRESVMEIDFKYRAGADVDRVVEQARQILVARHGDDDFTVTTQDQMLEVLGTILNLLTAAVAAIGAISLVVGAVGILTIMSITVNERTEEIGLLRAIGATRRQIGTLFLGEATALSAVGGLVGLAVGVGVVFTVNVLLPDLPVANAWHYIAAALMLSVAIGLATGVAPARRAARIDPIEALRTE